MKLPNVLYLVPLEGIEFKGDFDGSEGLSNLPITNNAAGIAHYLTPFKRHIPKIGEVRYGSILESKAFVYLPLIFESESETRAIKAQEELKAFFPLLNAFFRVTGRIKTSHLWVVQNQPV